MFDIRRDALGIPHVTASSLDEMFAGQGFATAEDRAWHLEYDRRRALGTLAAITGSASHALHDGFARRARIADHARAGFARLHPTAQGACTALAAGINAGIEATASSAAGLSPQFARFDAPRPEPFEGWHVVAIFIVRHLNFASWQKKLWNARVVAALGADALRHFCVGGRPAPLIVPSGLIEAVQQPWPALPDGWAEAIEPLGMPMNGSNCWAVSAAKSATGAPVIAGDPHRSLEFPNVYYQIGLACPSEGISAAGISFPGIPGFPHFGQNEHVAWGVTNAIADYQDLFIERLGEAGAGAGGVIDRRVETVEVRGAASIEVECLLTRHGPVVVGDSSTGVGLALATSELPMAGGSLATVIPQLRATTIDELDAAMAGWLEPVNNFVIADRTSIGYRTAGRIPIRTEINAWLPVPGWTDEHDWTGTIPDTELPRLRDPDIGAVVTANQRITGDDYPYLIHVNPATSERAERIWERLDDLRRVEVDDHRAIHTDTYNLAGRRFASLVGGSLNRWDGTMDVGSREAALFARAEAILTRRLTERLPAALRANPFSTFEPPATAATAMEKVGSYVHQWIADDDRWLLTDGETWASIGKEALAAAEAETPKRQKWGAIHRMAPLPLGGGERLVGEPVSGADGCVMATVHVAGYTTEAWLGSTSRYLWDLGDRSRSGWVVPFGVAEDPGSPHAFDQATDYAAGRLHQPFIDETPT